MCVCVKRQRVTRIWTCLSHGEHTRWLSHVAHNVIVFSSRKKNTTILDENGYVYKKSPLTQNRKNQHGHEKGFFSEDKVHSECRGA